MPPRRRIAAFAAATAAAAAAAETEMHPSPPAAASNIINTALHLIGIIFLSHAPPKAIRFSLSRDYFKRDSNYGAFPGRLIGEIVQ